MKMNKKKKKKKKKKKPVWRSCYRWYGESEYSEYNECEFTYNHPRKKLKSFI